MGLTLFPIEPANSAITVPAFGTMVNTTTTDWKPSLSNLTGGGLQIAKRDLGTAGTATDDCWYIIFGADSVTTVRAGDYRIGGGATTCDATDDATPRAAFVKSTDTDVGQTIEDIDGAGVLTDLKTVVKYLELDGKPGLSPGDGLYVDVNLAGDGCNNTGAGLVEECDLRLSTRTVTSTSLSIGTQILSSSLTEKTEASDIDGSLPDENFTDVANNDHVEVWYYDVNENRVQDSGDALYLRILTGSPAEDANGAATPGGLESPAGYAALVSLAVDFRLTDYSSSYTRGNPVAPGDPDHVPTLEASPDARVARLDGSSAGNTTDDTDVFFITWGAKARLAFGDIAINTKSDSAGTSYTFGTMATTAATGVGKTIDDVSAVNFTSLVFYVDFNGNGRFDDADGLYMNRPTELGGPSDDRKLSAEDIRLRAYSSLAAGTVVASTDGDMTSHANQGSATTFDLKWFDADRTSDLRNLRGFAKASVTGANNALDVAGEAVYIDADSTGNVTNGDTRLTQIAYAVNSTVATGNADLGANASFVWNFRLTDNLQSGNGGSFETNESFYNDVDNNSLVSAGDIRVYAGLPNATAFAVGSTVATGNADVGVALVNPTNVTMISGSDTTWTAASEAVYLDDDAAALNETVAAGWHRFTDPAFAEASTVSCIITYLPGNADCGVSLKALTNAKITGSDGTFTSGTDQAYVSTDHAVNAGDVRITKVTYSAFTAETKTSESAVSTVLALDPDIANDISSIDGLYLSPTELFNGGNSSKIPLQNDYRLKVYTGGTGSAGSVVTTGDKDHALRVRAPTQAFELYRFNGGDSSSLSDDGYYASTETATSSTPATGDARLVAVFSYTKGTLLNAGDTDDTVTIAEGPTFTDTIGFVNPTGSKSDSVDTADYVYVNTTSFDGTGGDNFGLYDVRLINSAGSTTSGTIVKNGESDLTSYGTQGFGTLAAGLAWKIKYIDHDADGTLDAGGTGATAEHLLISADVTTCATATPCSGIVKLADVMLTSASTSTATTTTTTTSGTGGTTTTTTTSGTATTTTTTSGTDTTTTSGTDGGTGNTTTTTTTTKAASPRPTPGWGPMGLFVTLAVAAMVIAVRRRR